MNVADKYIKEVRENKPIRYEGLEFYPLTVKDYALFRGAKPAMEIMQSSLPPDLARLSWCVCLDELDKRAKEETGKEAGFLASIMLLMAVALRLDFKHDPYAISLAKHEGKLKSIIIKRKTDTVPKIISTRQMSEVRQILALQNSYEIPDERWNAELVRAQQYLNAQKTSDVVFDLETLVYSVAANMKCRAAEIWEWPIREFQLMQAGIDRSLNYQIYTAAEASCRVKFKNGNPYPTWKFERKASLPAGFMSIGELDAGAKGLLAKNE